LTAKKSDCHHDRRYGAEIRVASILNQEVFMRKLVIAAMAFFVVFGVGYMGTQAGETKAKMEEMKGDIKSSNEETKGEIKALREEAKGNDTKAAVERGKGKMKSGKEQTKAKGKELKAKTE
jgi:Sec-independent protein translocase protein TatA